MTKYYRNDRIVLRWINYQHARSSFGYRIVPKEYEGKEANIVCKTGDKSTCFYMVEFDDKVSYVLDANEMELVERFSGWSPSDMAKFDAFDIGKEVIMAFHLPADEVERRLGSTTNEKFMKNRQVGQYGKILATFPKDNLLYVSVDGLSTAMFMEEVVDYQDDVLDAIVNPPASDWVAIHNWLG